MIINWYGQSCFRIQTKDIIIYTDPFDKNIGLRPPQGHADVVTISHDHYDHNNVVAFKDVDFLINTPGEFALKGLNIQGIDSLHNDKGEKNTIFIIDAEDLRICHLGDLGEVLSDEQVEKIGNVDILFVPVGEKVTLGVHNLMKVISEIEPRIIIPMHYKIEGLEIDLETVDKFVKEIGVGADTDSKLTIKKKDIDENQSMKLLILQKI